VGLAVAGAYAAALLFLVLMFVMFDLLFEMHTYLDVAKRDDVGAFRLVVMLVEYHLIQMPIVFVTIAPFVTVIATMFALSKLMAANEIAPMLFTGRSLLRILRPMLGIAVFSAVAMGVTWQWVIPNIAEQHERLHAALVGGGLNLKRITVRAKDNPRQELFCREYDRTMQKMSGVIVYNRGSSRGDGIYLEAAEACWNLDAKDWDLTNGWRKTGEVEKREIVPQARLGMNGVTPKLITDSVKAQKQTSSMSYTELRDLMQSRPGKADYVLAFHVHFTFPLANLVLVLLALPFAVNFERGRRIERIVFAILICAGYLVVDLICQNLAFDNHIHPIVAAWTPTIVFGSLGAVVFGGMRS
jgi:lipopolysaccharide export system permease protein